MLDGQIDFAVHSFKDVPVTMPLVDVSELVIAATPVREDARDAIAVRPGLFGGSAKSVAVASLPTGRASGRAAFAAAASCFTCRPDLQIEAIRGNIDTRLRKVEEGQYDAVILAMAGLRRAGLFNGEVMSPLETTELLPAPGQGALALQCRAADAQTRHLLQSLHDPDTAVCVEAERALVAQAGRGLPLPHRGVRGNPRRYAGNAGRRRSA